MTIRKEELASSALAIFAILAWIAFTFQVGGNAGEWPITRFHRAAGLPIGMLALGVLSWSLAKGNFGNAERNGRISRPYVFWTGCFFFGSMGLMLPIISIMAVSW
jgi:hypothetical protein